jgi:glucose/arabinose dehydrogenase
VDVVRYPTDAGSLTPEGAPETIASGFPEQNEHRVKTITFDDAGHLYVNVGAPSNACMEQHRTPGSAGMDPCPQREWHAGVWRFQADRPGQTQREDGHHYATGTRNLVALRWNDDAGSLYAVQHGRDQLSGFWPERFDAAANAELPAEEFIQIAEGDDFGWPYCYYDTARGKKVLAPEYGGDGEEQGRCAEKKDPILAFPAHMAPNDLIFYTGEQFPESYRGGAFVAFHGSWNRAPLPQKGYFVAFVPFADGKPSGEWSIFADGFAGLAEVAEPGNAAHRPCGLAQGPDGSLYVSDSVQGTIWRIRYTG